MDNEFFVIKIYKGKSEITTFAGNEWRIAFEFIDKLRKSKLEGMEVIILRGIPIERFKVKK